MEVIIVILLTILTILVGVLLYKQISGKRNIDLELLVKNTLFEFRGQIQESVNTTRKEMSDAREDINQRTRETLTLMTDMRATVEKIINQQEESARLGRSLKDILQAPKIRGNYGEAILEEMLDKVLPRGMWTRQYKLGEGAVVDIAVNYRDMIIPIDSKFPRDNYLRYMNSEDPKEKELLWKQFEKDVILRIREIGKYIAPDRGTSDFALMFIPSEAVYYETIAEKNYLGHTSRITEEAEKNKVMPVSPNTFYAFLQIIMSGIRNMEVLRQARTIQEKLVKLETRFDYFYKQYEIIGRELDKASEAYRKGDRHIGLFKRVLDETIRLDETIILDENVQSHTFK
ncbi:DNA recombination protein RmuC [Phosphitispora sp. TUW77]|uniref:DNA recombination protein RmuC n=1 Tax=Phosphitispora sp. TUW77 TaxID=3152361 RepID=UPI003AB69307